MGHRGLKVHEERALSSDRKTRLDYISKGNRTEKKQHGWIVSSIANSSFAYWREEKEWIFMVTVCIGGGNVFSLVSLGYRWRIRECWQTRGPCHSQDTALQALRLWLVVSKVTRHKLDGRSRDFKDAPDDDPARLVEHFHSHFYRNYHRSPVFFVGTLEQAAKQARNLESIEDVRVSLYR